MKKIIAVFLACALMLAMSALFTACGNNEESYANEETSEVIDVYAENDNDLDNELNNELIDDPSEDNGDEPADEPDAANDEPIHPFAPPENLNTLGQAAQLEYFNAVVNRVRNERPGFHVWEQLRIDTDNMTFTSGFISAIQPVVNAIITRVMPGVPESQTIARGANNQGHFMSLNPQASTLRLQDIASISSRREDSNWIMEVRIREEANPQHVTGQHARISFIMDRDEVIDLILSAGPVSVNRENVDVVVRNGVVRITVNADGQIIAAERNADIRGDFTDARIAGFRSDGVIPQTSSWRYSSFVW